MPKKLPIVIPFNEMRVFLKKKGKRKLATAVAGEIIFQSKSAAPVIQRKSIHTKENVDWIMVLGKVRNGKRSLRGGFGLIWWGVVKFNGLPKPKLAVIKSFRRRVSESDNYLRELVKRLTVSRAPHPKMEFFTLPNAKNNIFKRFIVMEPFLKFKGELVNTRFLQKQSDLLGRLNLHNSSDRAIARQALELAFSMAENGLCLGTGFSKDKKPRADIFNAIKLKDGSHKLYILDLDTLALSSKPFDYNWRISSDVIYSVLCYGKPQNASLAKELIAEVGQSPEEFNYR
ncbi:MAG: hypothetical protein WCI04_03380 [archaeon]